MCRCKKCLGPNLRDSDSHENPGKVMEYRKFGFSSLEKLWKISSYGKVPTFSGLFPPFVVHHLATFKNTDESSIAVHLEGSCLCGQHCKAAFACSQKKRLSHSEGSITQLPFKVPYFWPNLKAASDVSFSAKAIPQYCSPADLPGVPSLQLS